MLGVLGLGPGPGLRARRPGLAPLGTAACLRASAAGFDAALHVLVVADLFAGVRTGVGDLGACWHGVLRRGAIMQASLPAGPANVGAVHQELQMLRLSMLAALLETV